MNEDNSLPLSGIRVLEMGQLIAGPFAGQMLAAFGAEVVKIEPPGRGDPLRTWRVLDEQGTSYWWRSLARNKKSLTLDLSQEQGADIARQLMMQADILIENFRPGRMEAWGLGPDAMKKLHPELIYTRVSGYGQSGPYARKPGFASACEAAGGLRYVNGYPDEKAVRMNLSLGDTLAGMHATVGALLALIARQRLGQGGQTVDVSIVESVFNMLEGVLPEYDGAGVVREPSGSTVTGIVPTNTYQCSDGRYIVIGGNGDSIFKRLMVAIGQAELAEDARLADNRGRVANEAEIDALLSAWSATVSSVEALEILDAADVPAGPVNSIADMVQDPHFQARDMFESLAVNGESRLMPAVHPRLERTPASSRWAGPELGQHTDEVLRSWLRAGNEDIARWREKRLL
ncbi:CaiB/BaiF CoA transferase family protein [Granulosicoccus sp. 3-233]|uniref:CaiB/BaiF CoA transferase family protein n=1 Tax=Granulosicoccus sp. 3-233 TaxID=3417969 RepID=UPI003D33FCC8